MGRVWTATGSPPRSAQHLAAKSPSIWTPNGFPEIGFYASGLLSVFTGGPWFNFLFFDHHVW